MSDDKDLSIDAALIRSLAALLDETRLTEIEYAVGEKRIRVVRAQAAAPASISVTAPQQTPAARAGAAAPELEPAGAVKSPMVGTVYLAPAPGAAAFVKIGDTVRQGQTLLIIEAMKVMNQIAAPRAGRVTQILVTDGIPVEYGQPLLVLE